MNLNEKNLKVFSDVVSYLEQKKRNELNSSKMELFFWFLGGSAIGLSIWLIARRKWKLIRRDLLNQKNQLAQEKKLAVEFMHNLAEAIGEGVERKVLYQRIVHTSVVTTGAMSACIYEKLPSGRLKGVAVEGFFLPTGNKNNGK